MKMRLSLIFGLGQKEKKEKKEEIERESSEKNHLVAKWFHFKQKFFNFYEAEMLNQFAPMNFQLNMGLEVKMSYFAVMFLL